MANDDLDRINEGPLNPNLDSDAKAQLEANDLFKKSKRYNRRTSAINWCYILFAWFCLISVSAVVLAKILHFLLPMKDLWLNKQQLADINDFFVDGSIGALVVGFVKSGIIDKEKN